MTDDIPIDLSNNQENNLDNNNEEIPIEENQDQQHPIEEPGPDNIHIEEDQEQELDSNKVPQPEIQLEQNSSSPIENKSEHTSRIMKEKFEVKLSDNPINYARDAVDKIEIRKEQAVLVERYMIDTGISTAFQVIFSELIAKKIPLDNFYTYTASRLRQIGKEKEAIEGKKYIKKKNME